MTASPPLNGHARPPIRIVGDWQPVAPEPVEEQRTPQPEPAADAEVARARAWAEAEERRVAAEAKKEAELKLADAEADAIRLKGEEEARKLRLANDRAERKSAEEQAASEARIAEHNRRREDAERARRDATREEQQQRQSATAQAKAVEKASKRWRNVALAFYILCAGVALPVQMAAFYNPDAKYLLVAPVFIEVIALVALVGAAAAVTAGRPHWHYRLVAWAGALTAASINIVHGLAEYDAATAFGTALASIAGPGMWDLHEHGRIRKRDGKPSWRQRRAAKKAAKAEAKRQAAEEKRLAAEREAADEEAEEARQQLAAEREEQFPDVWPEAVKIAAAVGSTVDDDAVWVRAYRNIKGCDPGESIESITARRAAEKRVEAALTGTPVNTLSKTTNAQRAIQIKNPSRRSSYRPVPPVRKTGDTPPYHPAARRAHGETKRRTNAAKKDPS
jgi:hypothetical protein